MGIGRFLIALAHGQVGWGKFDSRGSPKPTKRKEGEKEGEKEGKEEGGRGKKKRRGIQLIILLAIRVLCSSIYHIQC